MPARIYQFPLTPASIVRTMSEADAARTVTRLIAKFDAADELRRLRSESLRLAADLRRAGDDEVRAHILRRSGRVNARIVQLINAD